jgi:hypothetical protein
LIKQFGRCESFVTLTCLVTKHLKITEKMKFFLLKQIERCVSFVTLTCLVTKRFKITEKHPKTLLNRLKDVCHL